MAEKEDYEYTTIPGMAINKIRKTDMIGGASAFVGGALDWWRSALSSTPKAPAASGTYEAPKTSGATPAGIPPAWQGPPSPTSGSRMPMPDRTRVPAIQTAQAGGHTFTDTDIEKYYGKPGVGEDYRQLWDRAGQNPNMFGDQSGYGMVKETTPGSEGTQRFTLPGGSVPMQGARTKSEIEDAKNIETAQKLLHGAQSPGGVSTAIPTAGGNRGPSEWMAQSMTRLKEIQGDLSGSLRKSKRASLVAEQDNIMQALTSMSGQEMQYEVGMGNLGINQQKAATDFMTGTASSNLANVQAGAIPAATAETQAKTGWLKRQTESHARTPEEAHQQALDLKRAGAGSSITEDITKELIKGYVSANMSTEGLPEYLKATLPQVLESMGMTGGAPTATMTLAQFKSHAKSKGTKLTDAQLTEYYNSKYK